MSVFDIKNPGTWSNGKKVVALAGLLGIIGPFLSWVSGGGGENPIGVDIERFGSSAWMCLFLSLVSTLLVLSAWQFKLDMDGRVLSIKYPLVGLFGFFILLQTLKIIQLVFDAAEAMEFVGSDAFHIGPGLWLSFLSSLLLLVGAFLGLREERAFTPSQVMGGP